MKKLYRKGTVHPSPPIISDQLAFLPATILTLTAALTPEDREVLAYLISCSSCTSTSSPSINFSSGNTRSKAQNRNGVSSKGFTGGGGSSGSGVEVCKDHPPLFHCNCFRCYMSYWVRWDSSPNRQLIHEIIDAFEDWLAQNSNKLSGAARNSRRERRNRRASNKKEAQQHKGSSEFMTSVGKEEFGGSESKGDSSSGEDAASVEDEEKGSVRRFVDFIGERIWGVWG